MARRGGGSQFSDTRNNTDNTDALPQSTIAAQIVQNLSTKNGDPQPADRGSFQQLLTEILGAEGDHSAENRAFEKDFNVNYKLVCVVTKAGLDVLLSQDPFITPENLLVQASNSISVIHLTIQKTPQILFFSPTSGIEVSDKFQPPLFVLLLPKIFSLLGHPIANPLQEKLVDLLSLLFEVTTRSSGLWKRSGELLHYFRVCISAVLRSLEPIGGVGQATLDFKVVLPPDGTALGTHRDILVFVSKSYQTGVTDTLQASLIALNLLSVLLSRIWNSRALRSSVSFTKSDYVWALDSISHLWTTLADLRQGPAFSERLSNPCLTILRLLRDRLRSNPMRSRTLDDKAVLLLIRISADLLRWPRHDLTTLLESELCSVFIDILVLSDQTNTASEAVDGYLLPPVLELVTNGGLSSLSQDMQLILARILRRKANDTQAFEGKGIAAADVSQNVTLKDPVLEEKLRKLEVREGSRYDEVARPHKRRRLLKDPGVKRDLITQLTTEVFGLLGSQVAADLDGLSMIASNDQCRAFELLGCLACAGAGTLSFKDQSGGSGEISRCLICDIGSPTNPKEAIWDEVESQEVFLTLASLIKTPECQRSTKPRVWAMLAVRKLMVHTNNPAYLELAKSYFGEWCLQSHCSSLRELRIAAGRALPTFLRKSLKPEILQENRIVVLDFLRKVSDQNELSLQETCVLAWGQVAFVSSDDELNIVLLRLVQYLGHPNPIIYGLAYYQLQRLSRVNRTPLWRLLMPFWPSISVTVVKDLQTCPQTIQLLSDLLCMSVSEFLKETQHHTLPYLILLKKRDIILRVAQASGGDSSWSICVKDKNLAATLALLFVQPFNNVEGTTMALLREASPMFGKLELEEFAQSLPIPVAAELLKIAGDQVSEKKLRAHRAIQILASLASKKTCQSKERNLVGWFFETYVLGLMTQFAESINDVGLRISSLEKRRCLRAIEEMIKLAKSNIADGLPQASSALEADDLRDQAFSTWATMVITLTEEDIGVLLGNTFSIVVQYWDAFRPETQQRAVDMIGYLLKTYNGLIQSSISTIPLLKSIPALSEFELELGKLRKQVDQRYQYEAFRVRCQHENVTVVERALSELVPFLQENQSFLHISAVSEQPDALIGGLTRSVLDACVKFNDSRPEIANLCAQCLGLIGCVDPNRVEAIRGKRDILVKDNFERADEAIEFVVFFFQEILVKAFLSATDPKAQGFLAYVIQELLKFCAFDVDVTARSRVDSQSNANVRRWLAIPLSVRNTLAPFLTSRYSLTVNFMKPDSTYPIFPSERSHGAWLRAFVLDLLGKAVGENAATIFPVCVRVIRGQDISIANFLLPYVALNVIVGGTDQQRKDIGKELLAVLDHHPLDDTHARRESLKHSSETVFQVLDYLSRWMQEKKKQIASSGRILTAKKSGNVQADENGSNPEVQVRRVEQILSMIPADVISRRAVECKSYSRALFHWEMYIRQERENTRASDREVQLEPLFERMQEIYTQIDEPDGIEGISAHLHVLNIDQQILEHRKAGRWTAAQSWYELLLAENPDNVDTQVNLLTCLKESGQHEVLLNNLEGLSQPKASATSKLLPFAVEASWVTGKWDKLEKYLSGSIGAYTGDFNVGIGQALLALYKKDIEKFSKIIRQLRESVAKGLTNPATVSLQACHDSMLKLHVLTDIEYLGGSTTQRHIDRSSLFGLLDRRLEVVGAFLSDKQYLLGLQRAAMQLSSLDLTKEDIASSWLTSARLARKAKFTHQAFNAVLHASQLGAHSATIEHSRLLWAEGHHRRAIQSLEGAIAANVFRTHNLDALPESNISITGPQEQQNILSAQANLLLAKWLDNAGQTQSQSIIVRYRRACNAHRRWERGHYYLGRHYNKLFESERALPPNKRAQPFVNGEIAKLVIQNYLRSLGYGAKYIFQTLPRLLTLWLDLGAEAEEPVDPKAGNHEDFQAHIFQQRKIMLEAVHSTLRKYIDKLPAFVFFTAFPQIVARICHPNITVYGILQDIIVKVVSTHPQQALWALLAIDVKRSRSEAFGLELRTVVLQGQKLSSQLLHVCEAEIIGKPTSVSLTKDLGFNHRAAPCPLVVPLETTLTASLPTTPDTMKRHEAFARDTVTVTAFLDEVLVLNSLQRPRKVSVRGSDGHVYGLLCKPKDDLRKDQRLMTFNGMINRSLIKDAESSLRRLYIKTYAVTPLNEECGLIEWVDNLKPLRDILLKLYKSRGISPNYQELRLLLEEACSDPTKLSVFTKKILPSFPPIFHEWFVEMFPEPGAWFAARLKYTRSCAVMSMVGMVLGLGDRHGENILFEEGNGGTLHVDFNCLFDKGLTFEKPERVPFRLTHNMVDAFGVYGYEGPFRKSCELTMKILRQNEDTLMTILEAFLYDPTTDFIGKKKKSNVDVPDTPRGVLDSVQSKVRGLLRGESVPLSVEGHVHELIQQAVSPENLAAMYIGWCAFF
ncbi:hypothetical protein GP486_000316 [Trichoglossum hirsutum]|uniref:Serine/threonine-protein kinase MEC1 n=1 Tax=Trichoglossum hirsutum TaxID=265104 RepID=A0A9P8LI13_9PEZI|nr:hypothetical protein GP486_000316 [Trichoglossum hirsutum]